MGQTSHSEAGSQALHHGTGENPECHAKHE